MIAHHYCSRLQRDGMQCAVFDGNKDDSKLLGIEYIFPTATIDKLAPEEQKLWHPHTFEVILTFACLPPCSASVLPYFLRLLRASSLRLCCN
jgi:hypothetical protein